MVTTNVKSKPLAYLLCTAFMLVGVVIFILSCFYLSDRNYKVSTWDRTSSNIADIDMNVMYDEDGEIVNYDVIVEYEYNNEIYSTELGYYSSDMQLGDYITIYVNQDNPIEVTTEMSGSDIFIILFPGIFFFGMGLIFFLNLYSKPQCNLHLISKLHPI